MIPCLHGYFDASLGGQHITRRVLSEPPLGHQIQAELRPQDLSVKALQRSIRLHM